MFKLWVIYYWLGLLLRKRFKTREDVLKWQAKKLKSFQDRVLSQSDFYAAQIKGGKDVNSFPIIGKKEFVENFDTINTVGLKAEEAFDFAIRAEREKDFEGELNGITIGLSTGTSGNRSLFLASTKERALWAANVFFRVVKPKLFKRQKVSFILRADSKLYQSVSSSFFKFKFLHLATPIKEIIAELNAYQPDILSAQPSLMVLLARAQEKGELRISPDQIISYAEVLDELDRKLIERNFGNIITEVYQCTEGFLGHSCEHGSIHLHEDLQRFEKQYISPGRFQAIVTDFSRSSQPVVRYLMNDILVEKAEPCACGSPMIALERIEGRMDEILYFENVDKERVPIFPDFLRRAIVMTDERIENYQLIQAGTNSLSLYIDCSSPYFTEIKEKLRASLASLLASYKISETKLDIQLGAPEKHALDKMRRILRKSPAAINI